jgi:hypothetical protein
LPGEFAHLQHEEHARRLVRGPPGLFSRRVAGASNAAVVVARQQFEDGALLR